MRVLVNGMVLSGKKSGVGHYASELMRCLGPLLGEENLRVVRPGWVEAGQQWLRRLRPAGSAAVPRRGAPARTSLRGHAVNALRYLGRAAYRLQFRRLARQGFTLYHEPNFLPIECDLPTVTTILDLSVVLHPEWHPADRVAAYERDFLPGLAQSQHILTISEFARQEIIQQLGLPADRVSRTYLGIRPGLCPMPAAEVERRRRELNLPPNYLLYLGTIEPRKNLLMLLRAYCGLPGSVREKYPLVLAGGWGWNSADVAAFFHDEARHLGVVYLGYVPESDMGVLYNAARALVFPTLYEGFGLPPVEMLACGGAVLASTAGAIAETVGRKAHLIDPADLEGWREAMHRVCTDDDWWQALRRHAADAARPFTWERCAADTLAVYERIAFGTPSLPARAA